MTLDWIAAHPAAAALAALTATTSVAVAIRGVLPVLIKLADHAATKPEHDFFVRLLPRLDVLIGVLDVLRRVIPRVVMGPLPSTQPIASRAAGAGGSLKPGSMKPVGGAPAEPDKGTP